jgi:ubiquinone/menaquinone biosynthesis C-methylase UbiE
VRLLPLRLVRWLFELLYGPLAPIYDWVSRVFFLGQWAHWQRAALSEVSGQVLEVGAGTGALHAEAVRRGLSWIALDRSPAMVRLARQRFHPLAPPALLLADATALPLKAGQVDWVVSTFPSAYIVAPATGKELARVLRPEGGIVVVLAGVLQPDGPLGWLLDQLHRLVVGSQEQLPSLPAPPGFSWQPRWVASPRGRALVLVGRRLERRPTTAEDLQ